MKKKYNIKKVKVNNKTLYKTNDGVYYTNKDMAIHRSLLIKSFKKPSYSRKKT